MCSVKISTGYVPFCRSYWLPNFSTSKNQVFEKIAFKVFKLFFVTFFRVYGYKINFIIKYNFLRFKNIGTYYLNYVLMVTFVLYVPKELQMLLEDLLH